MIQPMINFDSDNAKPSGEPKQGDLLTVKLRSGDGFVHACARLVSIIDRGEGYPSSYNILLGDGFNVPKPYEVGDLLAVDREWIVDWEM